MYRFKRIFAIFLSVLLLSLTVGDAFISANDISRVYATGAEVIAGAAAADAAWELVAALLAATGLGGAAVANKDAVIDSYMHYLDAKIETKEYIIDKAIYLYDSAAEAVQSIPLDEFMDSLKNYHDSAVDSLTGIYARYCPELIGITKDFVSEVVAKNITIAGVTDSFATPMTAEAVAQQWSGEPFPYEFDFNVSYKKLSGYNEGHVTNMDRHFTADLSVPVCGIYSYNELNNYWGLTLYKLYNGELSAVQGTFEMSVYDNGKLVQHEIHENRIFSGDTFGITGSSVFGNISHSYSVNCPVFSSQIDAEAYLKGTGAVTGALNYSTDITDTIIDNNDLPTIGNFSGELWERIANASDHGIGAYGSGVSAGVNDWADDIPWVGLGDLQDLIDSVQDVYDKTIAGILDGTFDLPLDIPDYTYGDAWIDAVDRTWDDVIDNPLNDPAIDRPTTGDKDDPIASDKDKTWELELPANDLVPTIDDSLGDVAGSLKYKFPFSIPWDVRHVFQVLADTPKAPRFELPLVIKRFGIDERIIVDMAMFQVLSNLSRVLFSMLFGMYLMNLTFKVVAMRKEE